MHLTHARRSTVSSATMLAAPSAHTSLMDGRTGSLASGAAPPLTGARCPAARLGSGSSCCGLGVPLALDRPSRHLASRAARAEQARRDGRSGGDVVVGGLDAHFEDVEVSR